MAAGVVAGVTEKDAGPREVAPASTSVPSLPRAWNAENFAREQIRGLVRRTFLQKGQHMRQVTFSGAGPGMEVEELCRTVGGILAEEASGDVAVVCPMFGHGAVEREVSLRDMAERLGTNLWLLHWEEGAGFGGLYSYLGAVRVEFDYSVVVGPAADEPNRVVEAARFSEGVVLVLSALYTRRAAALRAKRALEEGGVRILGTVLTDREFPIPQSLYRFL